MALKSLISYEEQFQLLADQLTRANTHFYFAKRLHSDYERYGAAKEFWDYTLSAHFSIAMLGLCRVYDTQKKGINLLNSLQEINETSLNSTQREQRTDYISLRGSKGANRSLRSLRIWRNNIIAHYNRGVALDREAFDKNNPDDPEGILHNLIGLGFGILDWYAGLNSKNITYQRYAPGKGSYDSVARVCGLAPGGFRPEIP